MLFYISLSPSLLCLRQEESGKKVGAKTTISEAMLAQIKLGFHYLLESTVVNQMYVMVLGLSLPLGRGYQHYLHHNIIVKLNGSVFKSLGRALAE